MKIIDLKVFFMAILQYFSTNDNNAANRVHLTLFENVFANKITFSFFWIMFFP